MDQIVGVFDAHRQPQQAVGDAGGAARFCCHGGVRHGGRVGDQTLHAAQRFGEGKILQAIDERFDLRHVPIEFEAEHSSESLLLSRRQGVAGMVGKAGVVHLAHGRMSLKLRGDSFGVLLMLAQPHA